MKLIEICVPIIVAIMGIAYPILLQVITNLDGKLGSDISTLFKKEKEYRGFEFILYITLSFLLLYIIVRAFVPYININCSYIVIYFGKTIVLASTTALVVFFILLIHKMLKYYSSIELTKYLIEKAKVNSPKENYLYFNAIKSVYFHFIKKQDDEIVKTISYYIYSCFKSYRENHPNDTKGYPDDYYQMVYDTAQLILIIEKNKLKYVEHRAISGTWLIGEYTESLISEKTYLYLWYVLRLAIENKRDDLVLGFWEHSYQYFDSSLQLPQPIYSPENFKVLNEKIIEEKQAQRERFLQFHYALGGLLMFQKRYDCIRRIFHFTNSEPPKYVLLPAFMKEIFEKYIFYRDWYEINIPFIAHVYPFPTLEGMQADGVIRNWICKYIAILFLRQYTLVKYYSSQDFISHPKFPDSLGEKKFWMENIDYFNKLVDDLRNDQEMMNELGFIYYGNISDDWCKENGKVPPLTLMDDIKSELNTDIERTQIEQVLSPEKINQFYDSTSKRIASVFNDYQPINNIESIETDFKVWYSEGPNTLFEKGVFCEGQGVDYGNFHSILASQYIANFRILLSETFYFNTTKSYLLKEEDLQSGLKNLSLNSNNHIIISFDISEYTLKQIGGFSDGFFHEINYFNFPYCNNLLLGGSFFILNKSDLPRIYHQEINQIVIEKYKLKSLDDKLNLFAIVIDLHDEPEIREELVESNPGTTLEKYVLAYIGIIAEIRWKKNIDIIQIRLVTPYDQRGLPNSPDEVLQFPRKTRNDKKGEG